MTKFTQQFQRSQFFGARFLFRFGVGGSIEGLGHDNTSPLHDAVANVLNFHGQDHFHRSHGVVPESKGINAAKAAPGLIEALKSGDLQEESLTPDQIESIENYCSVVEQKTSELCEKVIYLANVVEGYGRKKKVGDFRFMNQGEKAAVEEIDGPVKYRGYYKKESFRLEDIPEEVRDFVLQTKFPDGEIPETIELTVANFEHEEKLGAETQRKWMYAPENNRRMIRLLGHSCDVIRVGLGIGGDRQENFLTFINEEDRAKPPKLRSSRNSDLSMKLKEIQLHDFENGGHKEMFFAEDHLGHLEGDRVKKILEAKDAVHARVEETITKEDGSVHHKVVIHHKHQKPEVLEKKLAA